jgi:hypothetical protein
MAIGCQKHMHHVNTLCKENAELFNARPSGTYSYHWALKCYAEGREGITPNFAATLQNMCKQLHSNEFQ